ncbi:hypothetical protein L2E82_24331 [Cichorium intybus]|uniref:Uncharacterized protein n=1 Tax=Cichorium intybus TaxID=13427 RepID=A0ACB9E092_CICIN|nr:hypothetical protein L2E82_24331 [Cichorium intybus]
MVSVVCDSDEGRRNQVAGGDAEIETVYGLCGLRLRRRARNRVAGGDYWVFFDKQHKESTPRARELEETEVSSPPLAVGGCDWVTGGESEN